MQPAFDPSPDNSESEEELVPIPTFDQNDHNFVPSTTIIWNEEGSLVEHDETSTSCHNEES